MAEATEIILNPNGNRRRDGRRWIAAQRTCLRALAPAQVTLVDSAEEAAAAAKEAAMKGYARVVSMGDPRTAHGVVNGLMGLAEGHLRQLKVGFLSISQPDQWSRTVGLPRDLARQLEVLRAGHTLPYDVGRVVCEPLEGPREPRHFLNSAHFGLADDLREEWRDPHTNLAQAVARIAGLIGPRPAGPGTPRLRVEVDGEVAYEGPCALGMLMEGRYDPTYGQIAPHADPTDGLLDVGWAASGTGWTDLLRLLGLAFGNLRLRRAATLSWRRAERVRVESLDGPAVVMADGAPVGRLPATFTVVRRVLPVMVEPVAIQLRKPRFKPVADMGGGRLVGNVRSVVGL